MNLQTPVLKRRSDELEGGQRQSKSSDGLYVEARDRTPRSRKSEQESTSAEPKRQGQKRKRSDIYQQRRAKRTCLTASALQSVQDEQKEVADSRGSEVSWGQTLSGCNVDCD